MRKIALLLLLALFANASVVQAQEKKSLTPADYKTWERLQGALISQDGLWIAYQIANEEGADTLYIKGYAKDTLYREAYASGLQFSPDSKFAVFRIGVSKKEQEALEEKKQPLRYQMGILDLMTGKRQVVKEVSSFRLPEKGPWLAASMYPPKDFKGKGTDLLLMNLETGSSRTLGNVSDYGFNKPGDFLSYIVQPVNPTGHGVELLDLKNQSIRILNSDTVSFTQLTWEKDGVSLAFMKTVKSDDFEEENHQILVIRNVYKNSLPEIFNPLSHHGFPDKMRVAANRLTWSDDEKSMIFGIRPWTPKEKKKDRSKPEVKDSTATQDVKKVDKAMPAKDEKLPGVDVWHWRDPQIQPRQQKTYSQDSNRSFLSVWNLESGLFMQVADSVYEQAGIANNQPFGWISGGKKYEPQFRLTYQDYLRVDLRTGARELILERHTGYLNGSPGGGYILYFSDNNWWSYHLSTGTHTNLTATAPVPFWDIRDDHPAEVRPPFGMGGWMKDDQWVLLYDEFDVWAVTPDGKKSMKLTQGREKEIIYRINRINWEEPYLDPKEPLYLSMSGDKSKETGYAVMKWGGQPQTLIYESRRVYGLTPARQADRFIFTTSTYDESPVLKLTGKDFVNPGVVVATNPQQEDFLWGKAELVDFQNKDGKPLQGVLHYPAGYEPGKRYPMVVYIYEIRSTSLHSYINPSEKSSYNITNYVQNGFFVFQPDIIYRLDDPGFSAVECVVPAVEKVISTGMIDQSRIGLMGHSWGAYQTAFIITQTDLFSAAVAGAPLTDMISMYTEIYWNTGSPNQGIFETSQGRFTRPYWEIMDKYLSNSPMFQAANIKTPLLVAFGDQDGAVDWHQGIELYSTMRRMEKQMVMLVYAGENHGLRKEENMKDYTERIVQWFDHFLLGKDAARWITEGVPYLEKMEREAKAKKKQ